MPTIAAVIRGKDLQKIDERIAKLRQLRELITDPECHDLLEEIFASHNGDEPIKTENSATARPNPPITKEDDSVVETVYKICRSNPEAFDIRWVLGAMRVMDFKFNSRDPHVTVGYALRKLAESGKIQVVRDSAGRRPKLYSNA